MNISNATFTLALDVLWAHVCSLKDQAVSFQVQGMTGLAGDARIAVRSAEAAYDELYRASLEVSK